MIILRQYLGVNRSLFGELNNNRVVSLTSSEFEPKMDLENSKEMLKNFFPKSQIFLDSDTYWKLDSSLEHKIEVLGDDS